MSTFIVCAMKKFRGSLARLPNQYTKKSCQTMANFGCPLQLLLTTALLTTPVHIQFDVFDDTLLCKKVWIWTKL